MDRGPNSIKKKCLYNKYAIEFQLEYLNSYWSTYKDENKFFKMGIIDAHEGTYEAIKYDDHSLYDFFTEFESQGLLRDTIMIIQTDHGNAQPGPFSFLHLEDFKKELSLPTLFAIIPTDIPNYSTVRNNILSNEQKFITPFTIYNSLLAILNDDSIPFSKHENYSIFSGNIPWDRTCDDFLIEKSLCRCQSKDGN